MRYLYKDNLEQQKKTSLEIIYYTFSWAHAISDIMVWEDMMSFTAVEHQGEIFGVLVSLLGIALLLFISYLKQNIVIFCLNKSHQNVNTTSETLSD